MKSKRPSPTSLSFGSCVQICPKKHQSNNQQPFLPILFRFNIEFLVHFISNYLDLECMSSLDVALTNRYLRRCYWLECLSCPNFKLPTINSSKRNTIAYNFWTWLLERNIPIKHLEIINNSMREVNMNAALTTEEEFKHIVVQCSASLETLRIYSPDSFTESSFVSLSQLCPKLMNVVIFTEHLNVITNNVFGAIGQHCHSLLVLEIKAVRNKKSTLAVTDRGILNLVQGCPLLDTLTLQCCRLLTNNSILYFQQHSPILYSLQLSGCDLLTEKCLHHFMSDDGFQKLQYLVLTGCGRMSDTLINRVIDYRPKATIEIWEQI